MNHVQCLEHVSSIIIIIIITIIIIRRRKRRRTIIIAITYNVVETSNKTKQVKFGFE